MKNFKKWNKPPEKHAQAKLLNLDGSFLGSSLVMPIGKLFSYSDEESLSMTFPKDKEKLFLTRQGMRIGVRCDCSLGLVGS